MRFEKQPTELTVRNNDICSKDNQNKPKRHGDLFPNNVRMIISGSSGSGKSNLILSLILDGNGLRFENIYIYCKTLDQDKYKYLEEVLRAIKDIGYYAFNMSNTVLTPDQMKENSIVIFDDVISCSSINRDIVQNIFTLGRHRCIDVVYLVQTYTKLSKHLIRDNCNFVILFRQDDTNLKHVFSDTGSNADMSFNEFKSFCLECWREPFGFACISLEHPKDNGRYRKKFDQYLKL